MATGQTLNKTVDVSTLTKLADKPTDDPTKHVDTHTAHESASRNIQNCYRFWSAPRWRAGHYDPASKKYPPGATRFRRNLHI